MSINFLTEQLSKTNVSEVKKALSELIQNETEKLMLVEVNKDYVFRVIDPPIIPERKSKPTRSLICIIGFILGVISGSLVSLFRFILKDNNIVNN